MAAQNKPLLRKGTTKPPTMSLRGTKQSHDTIDNNKQMTSAKKPRNDVPQLRFAEFEGDGFTKNLFENIFEFSTGKNIKQNQASPEFDIPCVRYGELYHMYNEVIHEVINKTNLDRSELKFSDGDEILLPSAGEDPLDIGSASALTIENIAIGRTINVLKPKNKSVYSQIYASYYINQKLKRKIASLAKGVSISNVYNSDLKGLYITMPTLPEQQKIASFLTAVDTKLQQLTQKKELLAQYKKGVMQQLFSQKIRFKPNVTKQTSLRGTKQSVQNEYPDWEEKKLGEVGRIITGKTPSTKNKALWNGNIPFITPSDIEENTKYLLSTERFVAETKSLKILPVNTIAYTCIASIGKMCLIKNRSITNQQINSVVLNEEYDPHFIYYSLLYLTPKIKSTQANTTLPIINKSEFSGFKLMIPSAEEQQQIANYLSALDTKIESVAQQITQTQQFKKGLLQQMFV